MEGITLYYRQGASDKVYQANIQPRDDGFVVNFAFGRRGSTLQTGTKTNSPVSHEHAERIFQQLVREKQAKGYTPGENGTPYSASEKAGENTGIHCQLLNPVDESEIPALLASPEYWMQEKMDGRRMLVQKDGATITGINRQGLIVSLPEPLIAAARKFPVNFLMDGEAIGDELYAFDLLKIDGQDLRPLCYLERYPRLVDLLCAIETSAIKPVKSACTDSDKSQKFEAFKRGGKEGVVFKRIDAHYTPGRPASGGSQLKFKFCETASCIVSRLNEKRSVSLILFEGDKVRAAGNVTIPANHSIPEIGNIVEVRYLYAFRESGHLFQPVYLGKRDDIPREECTVDQLKFKAELEEKAA